LKHLHELKPSLQNEEGHNGYELFLLEMGSDVAVTLPDDGKMRKRKMRRPAIRIV
jgi:hypothetical protein